MDEGVVLELEVGGIGLGLETGNGFLLLETPTRIVAGQLCASGQFKPSMTASGQLAPDLNLCEGQAMPDLTGRGQLGC